MKHIALLLVCLGSLVPLLLAGCGGGGGDSAALAPLVDVTEGLNAPLPSAFGEASSQNLERLEGWEVLARNNPAVTGGLLASQVGSFVQAVRQDPNDPAAQAGLALSLVAAAGANGVGYLGYNVFEQSDSESVGKLAITAAEDGDKLLSKTLAVARVKARPSVPLGTSRKSPKAEMTPADFLQYQAALNEVILPILSNAIDRFAALGNRTPTTTRIFKLYIGGGEYVHFYPADFRALAGGLRFIYADLQMLTAINPNWGSYNWDLEMVQRDANHDGKLTVAEYAPPSPFSNVTAATWTAAGAKIRQSLTDVKWAWANRASSVPQSLLMRLAAGEAAADITGSINNLDNVANNQVTWSAACYKLRPDWTWRLVTTKNVAMKLRELWDTPPASFRSLLPQLFLMLESGSYNLTGGATANFWEDSTNIATGVVGYEEEWATGGTSPLSTAPHVISSPAAGEHPAYTLNFNWNFNNCTGTWGGSAVTGTAAFPPEVGALPKWADLPDKTLSGVFPTPDQVKTIIAGMYDRVVLTYGKLEIEL